jgi:hypothetical protein
MMLISKDHEWLSRRTVEYRSYMDDAIGMVEHLDESENLAEAFPLWTT